MTVEEKLRSDLPEDIKMVGEYRGKKYYTLFQCTKGHEWEDKPHNVLLTRKCPGCKRDDREKVFLEKLNKLRPEMTLIDGFEVSYKPANFKCDKGHLWTGAPADLLRSKNCSQCVNTIMTQEEFEYRVKQVLPEFQITGEYKGCTEPVRALCGKGHEIYRPAQQYTIGTGCRECHYLNLKGMG